MEHNQDKHNLSIAHFIGLVAMIFAVIHLMCIDDLEIFFTEFIQDEVNLYDFGAIDLHMRNVFVVC